MPAPGSDYRKKKKVLTPRFSGSGLCPCGRGGVRSLWHKTVTVLFLLITIKYWIETGRTTQHVCESQHHSTDLGSCWPVLPRPYKGITLSRLMPALQTGHTCLVGLVSNHCTTKTMAGLGRLFPLLDRIRISWRRETHWVQLTWCKQGQLVSGGGGGGERFG